MMYYWYIAMYYSFILLVHRHEYIIFLHCYNAVCARWAQCTHCVLHTLLIFLWYSSSSLYVRLLRPKIIPQKLLSTGLLSLDWTKYTHIKFTGKPTTKKRELKENQHTKNYRKSSDNHLYDNLGWLNCVHSVYYTHTHRHTES